MIAFISNFDVQPPRVPAVRWQEQGTAAKAGEVRGRTDVPQSVADTLILINRDRVAPAN